MSLSWSVSAIFTHFDFFSSSPNSTSYRARTDAKTEVISKTPYFTLPNPGDIGNPKFELPAFVGILVAVITSTLESVGDYHAAAAISEQQPPPKHAINRGIFMEGVSGIFTGIMNAGHLTTSYSSSVAAIGISRAASRVIFICFAGYVIFLGLFSKFSAVFLSIPGYCFCIKNEISNFI